ncbi:penicillin-binding protein 1A [Psychromonas sp. CD1]|uniref:penicillin-binding protein 1A n=1 Tax=Psychromonas sp. CD1 TaxID=1979839 RepID=UPI0015DB5815|nr:PBP1A family penicillin-binding protein [Psychromonas sp. CD1]
MMKWLKRLFFTFILFTVLGIITVAGIYYSVKNDLPDVASIQNIKLQVPMKVYSIDGELISQFGEKRRIPLTIDKVPKQLINAFIATEDNRFYQHFGIDPIGIVRAAFVLISTGRAKQGASTITQQVARNFFLTREKTFIRKIKEVFIAIELEKILSKDEILMLYLNKISLGHRAYGIGAAAQVYYGKTVQELTLSEMAVIAGLPKAPSRLNPIYSPSNAKSRRNIVLRRMLEENYITENEYNDARDEPIISQYHGAEITLSAHYAAEMARIKLIELYGIDRSYHDGFNVYTTINNKFQQAANKAVILNSHAYDERHGYRGAKKSLWQAPEPVWEISKIRDYLKKQAHFADIYPAIVLKVNTQSIEIQSQQSPKKTQLITWDGLKWARPFINDKRQGRAPKVASDIVNTGDQIWVRQTENGWALSQYPEVGAAFVSLNPKDGAITAMVGGFSYIQSKFNRATQAQRQIGSTIKPFIYSTALDNGYTLATLINDAPINHWTGETSWRPKNSPPVYDGPIRLRLALGKSKNVVSVRLVQDLGVDKVIDQLAKFGFNRDKLPRSLSLALGSASTSPLELAVGYAMIANGGHKIEPYLIERIEDAYGNIIYQAKPKIVCDDCAALYQQMENTDIVAPESESKTCAISPVAKDQIAPQTISPENAFLVSQLLNTAIWGGGSWRDNTGWNGTGWRAMTTLNRHDIGGKTGTTNDSKDAWFAGYLSKIVAISWVGFDNFNRNLGKASWNSNLDKNQISGGEFGARTALPAWNTFMLDVGLDQDEYMTPMPVDIGTVRIDRETGLLSNETDYHSRFEYFIKGTEPTDYAMPSALRNDANSEENEIF